MAKSIDGKEKKDFFTAVMLVQTAVSAVLIIALLVSFRGDGKFADMIRNGYLRFMATDFTAEDFSEAFNEFKEFSSSAADKIKNSSVQSVSSDSEESQSVPAAGGIDLEFSSLEALEGISFEDIDTGFSMSYPLDAYSITSEFGYRKGPISGEAGIHTGLDMAAAYGTAIHAAADGKVVDAAWDNSYGNYVKLLHDNNTVSIYAHCSKLCVSSGDTVEEGEKIAEVGSTGASTGNHLHFEVRKDNIRINPEYLLNENG